MSVTVKLNRAVIVGGIAAVALVTGAVTVVAQQSASDADPSATRLRTPSKAVDVVDSHSPAKSAIATSQRFFASSPVAVLTDSKDHDAQRLAIRTATTLGAPVLIDHPQVKAEIGRLGAKTVLTFGHTRTVPGAIVVTEQTAAAEIARVRHAYVPVPRKPRDAIVVTRNRQANAAAVANAVNAGADVLQLPTADPRRDPAAAKVLAARPSTPVIALGNPFTHGFAYSLAIVRRHVTQAAGGYLALPGKTYTALYGHPKSPSLGVLGEQGVRASVARAEKLVRKYRRVGNAHFVPTFEIIATVASSGAGKDKNYSNEVSSSTLRPLIDAAGKAGVYVILDLQPGRSDFLSQAKRYRSLLLRPYVGLALDPEWRLTRKQKPLRQIGSVKAGEINRTSSWLARLTREHTLPQKIFVLHEFSSSMIKHRSRVDVNHAELATVIHVDGQGSQPDKQGTWKALHRNAPKGVFWGWKNFVDEDHPMLDARKTWRNVRPRPNLVSYQ
ncbi:MAG: hypothetical protein QOJ72_511 [Nocardioidaceae bacterium]|nr:hypothetical protein [Nocardioidaceae bacterium]